MPAFVARQPIYDRRMEVEAYEMLFRASESDGRIQDADAATAATVLTTFADIGLHSLVGGRTCFVNVTREFIANDFARLLPADRVALEVKREAAADPEAQARLAELARMGYTICLDGFVVRPDSLPLLDIAHIVKLDVLDFTDEQLREQVATLKPYPVRLAAQGIDDPARFQTCLDAGFDLFQGPFFSQPKTVAGKGIPANRESQMQLVAALQDPEGELESLDEAISRDLGVSYRLLRFVNSAYFSLPRKVNSVHEAIVLLGQRNVRSWAMLVTLAAIDHRPSELLRTALTRARMCEMLARRMSAGDPESFFTVGLFSVLDAFMGMTMEDVLAELPLASDVAAALLDLSGEMGAVLSWVLAYESGGFSALDGAGPAAERILRDAYLDAIAWADRACDSAVREAA
jgi:EAL and modified HD-GYP domain-containing signal transduction protein